MTDPKINSQNQSLQRKRKRYGGWWFLAVVLAIYIITALFNSDLVLLSLSFFAGLIVKVAPVLILVFSLIFLLNYLLNPQLIQSYVGTKSGIKGWLLAIVGGILSTGPLTAWYVMLNDLRQQGMTLSLAAVFLYSRAVKLPLLPMLIFYFGPRYTLVITVYLIGFSIVNGIIMGKMIVDQYEK